MPTLTQTLGSTIQITAAVTHTMGATISKRTEHTFGAYLVEPLIPVNTEESMTTAQRNALVAVQEGTIIYNTDLDAYQVYHNGSWVTIGATTPGQIPLDGAAGTVLTKVTETDFDVTWATVASAAGFYKSGAGATISDADFPSTPANGTLAVTYNTTNGRGYVWARTNGVWKSVQVT